MKTMFIGIAGGSGSGKTTLTRRLKERYPRQIAVVNHDNYYKRHDDLPFEERCKLNYDHPDAFDNDLLLAHLKQLRAGTSGRLPAGFFARASGRLFTTARFAAKKARPGQPGISRNRPENAAAARLRTKR